MTLIRSGERLDDLILGGLKLIQKPKGFCFSIDAVLLSHFVTLEGVHKIIDLGTGSGVIPLLLSTRAQHLRITGLEIQREYVEMGLRSIALNQLSERVEIVWGDIREVPQQFEPASFDLVVSNPPYLPVGSGKESCYDAKRIARHEVMCQLEDVIAAAKYLVTKNGSFAMVHRVARLADILAIMQAYGFGNLQLRMVHAYMEREAQLVLIEGRIKGGKRLIIEPPLAIYTNNGVYSEEIRKLYGR